MSNDDNYYTPTIDELHVGMEVEYRDPLKGGWLPSKIAGISNMEFVYILGSGRATPIDEVRIPYLTSEDIEAEGWVFCDDTKDLEYEGTEDEELLMHERHYLHTTYSYTGLEIFFYEDDLSVTIRKNGEIVFNGTIKNRHQLRQVMEMVGIKKEGS